MTTGSTTSIIAFVSGKGGTGKTGVSIAAGYLLANAGFKVGLVDVDPATHGMSYFFAHLYPEGSYGWTEVADAEQVANIPLAGPRDELDLWITPSITRFDEELVTDRDLNKLSQTLTAVVKRRIGKGFDYVLLDCQAGSSPIVSAALSQSNHAIIVTEADPVSIFAVNVMRHQFPKDRRIGVWGLVNKAFPEEKEYFAALTDVASKTIKFIGQLPFDSDVRRAFFRREAPIALNQPSPFVFALSLALQQIDDPRIKDAIDTSQLSQFVEKRGKRQERLEQMQSARMDLEKEVYSILVRRQRTRLLRVLLPMVTGALYTLTGFGLYRAGQIPYWGLVLALGGGAVAVAFALIGFLRPPPPDEFELDSKRTLLQQLNQRIAEYKVLTITSSQRHQEQGPPGNI